MALVFPSPPFVKDESPSGPLAVWVQGRDTKSGEYVEYRVISTALTQRCGAKGITNIELLRAFEQHREGIEETAKRKFDAGQVVRQPGRVVVWLSVGDLEPRTGA